MHQKSRRRPRWLRMLGLDREYFSQWRKVGLSSLVLLGVTLIAISHTHKSDSQFSAQHLKYSSDSNAGRRLLSETPSSDNASSHHGAVWEACTFEMSHIPGLWVFIHTILILIIFIALAIICDDFFVPSLEAISEKLHLSEDVAGATFMAAGSSAPELFTSVAGVAVRTDVGVGTIVGSAIFNLLIIIALTSALAGQVLHLDWRPLVRDSFFYAMSIACFIGFSWDGWFTHYESAILLSLYILYIILMIFNQSLMDWMATWKCCVTVAVEPEAAEVKDENVTKEAVELPVGQTTVNIANNNAEPRKTSISMAGGHARRVSIISQRSIDGEKTSIFHHHQRGSLVAALHSAHHLPRRSPSQPVGEAISENEEEPSKEAAANNVHNTPDEEEEEVEEDETLQLCPCIPCCPPVRTSVPSADECRSEGGCMNWFKFILKWIIFIPAFPFVCIFSWTIPDCSKPHNRKWFLASFLISVLWIALLSFGMVTLVSRTGCILKVDTYVMGLVIIAIGTSVPDCLSSILVARDGYGDMAVSNAIGSNVFDINLGLGLPFALRIAIDAGAPISLLSEAEWARYFNGDMLILPHAKFGFILLLVLVVAFIVFVLVRFRLSAVIGVSFVSMYILFLTYAFVQELYCVQTLDIYC